MNTSERERFSNPLVKCVATGFDRLGSRRIRMFHHSRSQYGPPAPKASCRSWACVDHFVARGACLCRRDSAWPCGENLHPGAVRWGWRHASCTRGGACARSVRGAEVPVHRCAARWPRGGVRTLGGSLTVTATRAVLTLSYTLDALSGYVQLPSLSPILAGSDRSDTRWSPWPCIAAYRTTAG